MVPQILQKLKFFKIIFNNVFRQKIKLNIFSSSTNPRLLDSFKSTNNKYEKRLYEMYRFVDYW